jgi:hypothetical protein
MVDLPDPDAPTSAMLCPGSALKLTPKSTYMPFNITFNFFPHACNLKTPNKRHKTQRFKLQGDEKGMDQGGRRAWHTMEMGCQRTKVAEFSMHSSFRTCTSRDEV